MTRPYVLSKQQYGCSCGKEHPLYEQIRIAGIPVLLCPECPDTALHPYWTKTNGLRLITGPERWYGPSETEIRDLWASLRETSDRLAAALARLDALEARLKKGAKE